MKYPSIMPTQQTNIVVDKDALNKIMDMGFPQWMATEALQK